MITSCRTFIVASLVGASALLASCGSGEEPPPQLVTPVAAGAYGAVTRLSPLGVNNFSFTMGAAGASFADRDDDGQGLKFGMIARITGSIGATDASGNASGNASSVNVSAEVRGAVISTTAGGSSFNLLGVNVLITPTTVLEGFNGTAGLGFGAVVQVHGNLRYEGTYPDGLSTIVATRVVRRSADDIRKLSGYVAYVTCPTCLPNPRQIRINSTVIDVSPEVMRGVTFPLAPGMAVRIKLGNPSSSGNSVAALVESYAGDPLLADSLVRVRGYASNLANIGPSLNGIGLSFSASTTYQGGAASELYSNRPIEVEGRYRSGIITVSSVRFL
jgi:hypothetical protein